MVVNQPRWKEVEYSRTKIEKAGKVARKSSGDGSAMGDTTAIIDNWRAAHAYPLHVMYINLRRLAGSRDDIIVAERLKRLESIISKLKREPKMNLWSMQDLGGCRFIVPTLAEVYHYSNKYKNSRVRHLLKEENDYIKQPKSSGYRSLHLIYQFKSETKETYNRNMLIEFQFRTRLQHSWATAVETMGLINKEELKAGKGDVELLRFFTLISSLFAIKENSPTTPNTMEDNKMLIEEIKTLDERHRILDKLSAIREAINHQVEKEIDKKGYYILVLNYQKRILRIKYFKPSEAEEANKVYISIENKSNKDETIDAVLVRAASFNTLRYAYPNYFLDIGEFVEIVKEYFR